MMCLPDLRCWLHLPRLSLGLSLRQVSPDLHLVRRLGSELGRPSRLSGRFQPVGPQTDSVVYNARELLAVQLGLIQFRSPLQGRTVAVFYDYATAVTYLCKEGGTRSPLLNTLAHGDLALDRVPLHPPGSTVPSGLRHRPSRRPVSPSPAPTYRVVSKMTVFLSLRRLWPVQIVIRSTSPLSGIRGQQARTRFSSPGTAFRLTRSLMWLSFRVFSRSSEPPRGRFSLS